MDEDDRDELVDQYTKEMEETEVIELNHPTLLEKNKTNYALWKNKQSEFHNPTMTNFL